MSGSKEYSEYIVKDIAEPDFGCEGLPDGEELCCEVLLESVRDGSALTVKAPDAELYEKDIDIGSRVIVSGGKLLRSDMLPEDGA